MNESALIHKSYEKSLIAIIFILVFLLSLFFRLDYRKNLRIENPIRGDAYYYLSYGYNLVKHNTFSREPTFYSDKKPTPDAFCPPGFPYMVASAIRVGGFEDGGFYPVLTFYNAAIGALIAPIVLLISIQFLPILGATIASLITAASPHMLSIGGYVLTENLFSFVHLASILFLVMGISKNKSAYWGMSGLFMGLSYLINPIVLFLPFILSVVYCGYLKKNNCFNMNCLKQIGIYISIFILVVGLWAVRNKLSVSDSSLKSTDRAAINLINGLYPDYYDSYKKGDFHKPDYPMNIDIKRVNGSIKKASKIIMEKIIDEPIEYLRWYFIDKPLLFWSWDIGIGEGDVYVYKVEESLFTKYPLWDSIKTVYKIFNPVLIFLIFCGYFTLYYSPLNKKQMFFIHLIYTIIVYSTFIHTVFQADPRYSIPFRPEFYMAVVFTFIELFILLKNRVGLFVK